jgi:hypothetical protein
VGATTEDRAAKIAKTVAREYAKGTALAAVRKILAKTLGGTPDLYLGTADPVYYRLVGLDSPLTDGRGAILVGTDEKPIPARVLASAVRRRRDSGVRWNVLAASVEASTGRRTSIPETKTLYEKGSGDLDSSYVGRGTRKGAPATYEDLAVAAEVSTLDA